MFNQFQYVVGTIMVFLALVSLLCSICMYYLIANSKIRNGYTILLETMTSFQIIYDGTFLLTPAILSPVGRTLSSTLFAFSLTGVTVWTNILSLLALNLLYRLQTIDVKKYYYHFLTVALIPSIIWAVLWALRPKSVVLLDRYNYFRLSLIAFNIFVYLLTSQSLSSYVMRSRSYNRSEFSHVLAARLKYAHILASRLKYYPICQILSRLASFYFQMKYGSDGAEVSIKNLPLGDRIALVISWVMLPTAGIGYFIIYLKIQPHAYSDFKRLLSSILPTQCWSWLPRLCYCCSSRRSSSSSCSCCCCCTPSSMCGVSIVKAQPSEADSDVVVEPPLSIKAAGFMEDGYSFAVSREGKWEGEGEEDQVDQDLDDDDENTHKSMQQHMQQRTQPPLGTRISAAFRLTSIRQLNETQLAHQLDSLAVVSSRADLMRRKDKPTRWGRSSFLLRTKAPSVSIRPLPLIHKVQVHVQPHQPCCLPSNHVLPDTPSDGAVVAAAGGATLGLERGRGGGRGGERGVGGGGRGGDRGGERGGGGRRSVTTGKSMLPSVRSAWEHLSSFHLSGSDNNREAVEDFIEEAEEGGEGVEEVVVGDYENKKETKRKEKKMQMQITEGSAKRSLLEATSIDRLVEI